MTRTITMIVRMSGPDGTCAERAPFPCGKNVRKRLWNEIYEMRQSEKDRVT